MKSKPARCTPKSESQIRQLMDQYRQSGLSAAEFARREKIGLSTFYTYQRRWRQNVKQPDSLVEVEVAEPPQRVTGEPTYRIELRNGHCLEVASGFCPAEVKELVQLMGGAQ